MPKARPDQVIVHRIELQQTERDLLEAALIGNGLVKTVGSITPLLAELTDPVKLYGLLTLLEAMGLLDTPVPTLTDASEDISAATIAIRDFFGLQVEYQHRQDANAGVEKTAAVQAEESNQDAQTQLAQTAEAHKNGDASWDDVRAAQDRANAAQAEAWRQNLISQQWEYKFYFEQWDLSKARGDEPPKGRWPTKSEINIAKGDGVYYNTTKSTTGLGTIIVEQFTRGFLGGFGFR